jgi:biopolymer transport protein ExbB/TolQ
MAVEEVLFEVADALRIPVLVLALLALAIVVFELGGMIAELVRRRGRGVQRLDGAVAEARQALAGGDAAKAKRSLWPLAASRSMRQVLGSIVDQRRRPGGSDRIAKDLAEFDYASIRRLERTRMLVRIGPALGLMGTLIPLSPALAGLAEGDIETLSENLRVAFSVTVAGLMVGAIAFAISLVRDRLYGQDFSDLEYVAAQLAPGVSLTPTPATTSPATPTASAKSPAAAVPGTEAATTSPARPAEPATPAEPAPQSRPAAPSPAKPAEPPTQSPPPAPSPAKPAEPPTQSPPPAPSPAKPAAPAPAAPSPAPPASPPPAAGNSDPGAPTKPSEAPRPAPGSGDSS